MDPNLFHVDWERTFEAVGLIILLAFLIERALAVVFEHRWFLRHFDREGVKEIVAVGVSVAVCWAWKFDAVSMIILTATTTIPGYIITGAVIAGGSKASIKLFHDLLNVQSTAYRNRHQLRADRLLETAEGQAQAAVARGDRAAADRAVKAASKAVEVAVTSDTIDRASAATIERKARAAEVVAKKVLAEAEPAKDKPASEPIP
jgi:hypothetical protein